MKMRIIGEVGLNLGIDRRWYVVEKGIVDSDDERIIGSPSGYLTHREASRWKNRYRAVREIQRQGRARAA